MRKLLCAVIALSVLFCACGCTHPADLPAPEPPEISDEDLYGVDMEEKEWPIIDGSAAFLPYYTAAASRLLGVSEEEASRYVLCSSSSYAYPDLISGKTDLIFCFLPNEEQVRLADHAGVALACYPVLNEALVFYVNADNPVEELSRQQLHDIYAGTISNWKEVGGKDEPIRAFQHIDEFLSQQGLTSLVIAENELIPPLTEQREGSMGDLADTVADFDGSEGALGFSYLHQLSRRSDLDAIKLLRIDGVMPQDDTIAEGTYPLISQACAVIRGGEEDTPAGEFAQWCAWPLGQALAQEMGYVPNQLQSETKAPQQPDPQQPAEADWAEGKAVPTGSRWSAQKNSLTIEKTTEMDEASRFVSGLSVSGLKDKAVEDQINGRIRETIDAFLSSSYVPDVQGIRAYEARGFDPEKYSYRYVSAEVTANSSNVLSVLISCSTYFDIPLPGGKTESLYCSESKPLVLDLNTGKDIPLTAWIADDTDALDYFEESAKAFIDANADVVFSEDTMPAASGTAAVRVTGYPDLNPAQPYYLDDAAGTVFLLTNGGGSWCIRTNVPQTIPVDLEDKGAPHRFVLTPDSLFE